VIELDAARRTDVHTLPGPAANLPESLFFEGPGGPEPMPLGPRRLIWLLQLAQFLGNLVDGIQGFGERPEQFAQALPEESPSIDRTLV
jgi:hypothetical protein